MNSHDNSLRARLATLIPRNMRYNRKDHRGYPVPYIVMWGRDGKPNFAINDHAKVMSCLNNGKCGICGKPLNRRAADGATESWFVGGAKCFLHPAGAFLDPPMHRECAEYALTVCPYLAIRGYGGPGGEKNIAGKQAESAALPAGTVILESATMNPEQPEIFGLGMAWGYDVTLSPMQGVIIRPRVPWVALNLWSNGRPLNAGEWVGDRENFTVRLAPAKPLEHDHGP